MGRALFVAFSVGFFGIYVLIANALGVFGTRLESLTVPPPPETGGGFLDVIDGVIAVFTYGFTLFSQFLALVTFQLPGQSELSVLTAVIFIPLAFANGYIVFTAIRGS